MTSLSFPGFTFVIKTTCRFWKEKLSGVSSNTQPQTTSESKMFENNLSSFLMLTTHSKIIRAAVLCKTTNNLTHITISQIYLLNQKTAQWSIRMLDWILQEKHWEKYKALWKCETRVPVSRWMLPCFTDKANLYIQDTDIALWILVCSFLRSFLWSFLCSFSCRLIFLLLTRGFVVFRGSSFLFRSFSLKSTKKGNYKPIKKELLQESNLNKQTWNQHCY